MKRGNLEVGLFMQLRDNLVEAIIGAAVLAVAAFFIVYAYKNTERGSSAGYQLFAMFPSAQGINVGSDVRVSGVKVGTVTAQELDTKSFQARVTFSVEDSIKLPIDTSIKVASEGLLGGNFLSLSPGGETDVLKPGEQIEQAQGSVDLMGLVGQAMFSSAKKKEETAADTPAQ
jgi:phospholipid/cholesterol/gamma-HCH transport system substrate-binding protein